MPKPNGRGTDIEIDETVVERAENTAKANRDIVQVMADIAEVADRQERLIAALESILPELRPLVEEIITKGE